MDHGLTIVPLAAADRESMFGGKAVALATAIRAGLPVPPGAAVAAPFVDRVAADDESAVELLLQSRDIPDGRLAVRSSAVGEDSGEASFAGQHVTRLNVARAGVPEAVRMVWRSGRCETALAYRARRGASLEPRVGIVIQALVEPVAAGVLFTRNPITGADERLIEAAWGLGEAVVNGAVVPDRYRLDPTGSVLEILPGDKDVKVWSSDADGTVAVPVPPHLREAVCLRIAHLAALHELARRCQEVWGPALDIEWALGQDGVLSLLQCRPITSAPARST